MKIPSDSRRLIWLIAGLLLVQVVFIAQFLNYFNSIKLKDYRPVSIYQVPETNVLKAKYPAIDMHAHDEPENSDQIEDWIDIMNETNIQKTVILSYETGAALDKVINKYAPYADRFDIWCGIDYTGMDKEGWSLRAVKELERCYAKGAKGVGELGDKGLGDEYSRPTPGLGMHIDDPRMKPLLKRCGELHLPISIHVAEDAWMYQPAGPRNDGMMNAAQWQVDMTKKGILNPEQLLATLENAVRDNPQTTFIACHLANTCADLTRLGRLLDQYPNLYADIAARYGELAPIPRFVRLFFEKYSQRIVYGTDMGYAKDMYETTFRILETADEHFYAYDHINYHWPLYGLHLSDSTLQNIYANNSRKILQQ